MPPLSSAGGRTGVPRPGDRSGRYRRSPRILGERAVARPRHGDLVRGRIDAEVITHERRSSGPTRRLRVAVDPRLDDGTAHGRAARRDLAVVDAHQAG